jgi:hypothetical protein
MIYCNLKGGLGNMLFQIATAYSLSLEKNTKPYFPNLDNQLNYLNMEKGFNPNLIHSFEYKNINPFNSLLTIQVPRNIPSYSYPFHYQELDVHGSEFMIDGFFQSEKYFIKHESEIKELFKPTNKILKIINDKYGEYLKHKTTAVHVRRGDYIKYPNIHPVQDLQYYIKGISLTKYDKVLIFSDDLGWCKQNFKGEDYVFIDNEKDYIELYLMSLCDNVVISNSSFSWWGGWLNNNINKVIVGPHKWFGNGVNHITSDIIPNSWIKI